MLDYAALVNVMLVLIDFSLSTLKGGVRLFHLLKKEIRFYL